MSNQIAYEPITVSTTAIGPTAATATARVRCAVFYIKGAAVRYRGDGTSPTASVGRPIEDGGHIVLVGEGTIKNALFIRRDSVDATIHAEYYDNVDVISSIGASNVEGLAAHDAPAVGNPVLIGAEADEASADNVDEGDVGKLRMTLARLLKTETTFGEPKELFEDEGIEDSNKVVTVTAGKIWRIHTIALEIATTTDAGGREFTLALRQVDDNDALVYYHTGGLVAADTSKGGIMFLANGCVRDTALVGTQHPTMSVPIPVLYLNDSIKMQILDNSNNANGRDADGDTMKIHIVGQEANE